MKRPITLELDPELLAAAMRATGETSAAAAVHRALTDLVRRAEARHILDLRGSGAWDGDLPAMRRDRPHPKKNS